MASEKSLTVPQVIITRQLSNPSQSVAASFALLFELKMRCALLGRLFLPDVSASRLDVAQSRVPGNQADLCVLPHNPSTLLPILSPPT